MQWCARRKPINHFNLLTFSAASSLTTSNARQITLNILATSDLHGHISPVAGGGLARVAQRLNELRAEKQNCLTFDNGDFLQGTAMCDLAADGSIGSAFEHPIVQIMNTVGYDAVGLGNHEFDFGLPFLSATLTKAKFPILCSNLFLTQQNVQAPWLRHLIINRVFTDSAGETVPLKIGLFSVTPPKVIDWNNTHLDGKLTATNLDLAAREMVDALKAQGADCIICLCHAGHEPHGSDQTTDDQFASDFAQIDGLDAIICGHTHALFPQQDEQHILIRNPTSASPVAAPMVQPADKGAYIGAIELTLQQTETGWRWHKARAENIPIPPSILQAPHVEKIAKPWIVKVDRSLSEQIGTTEIPLHSHWSALTPDPITRLTAATMRKTAHQLLADRGYPVDKTLVSASPFTPPSATNGGLPPGPITRRDLFDFLPFANVLQAYHIDAKTLRQWLENSARGFNSITPNKAGQSLWNKDFRLLGLESVFGLSYEIDILAPARPHSQSDRRPPPAPTRIKNMQFKNQPVKDEDRFILITNSYRAGGGGGFSKLNPKDRLPLPTREIRHEMAQFCAQGIQTDGLPRGPWTFSSLQGTSVSLDITPEALNHLPELYADKIQAGTDKGSALITIP